ncbi:MAG: hypothetical protein Q8R37_04150 [Nanoarchaeota archaeon]|nr:hypothetical protein [Nanoarchaeota archaeon]
MKNYRYSLSLYRHGDEDSSEAKYYIHMDTISGEDTLFSELKLVMTFQHLNVGKVNFINDLVYSYQGPQSDLLSKINPIFDQN